MDDKSDYILRMIRKLKGLLWLQVRERELKSLRANCVPTTYLGSLSVLC
jgi:hypothetical protein